MKTQTCRLALNKTRKCTLVKELSILVTSKIVKFILALSLCIFNRMYIYTCIKHCMKNTLAPLTKSPITAKPVSN